MMYKVNTRLEVIIPGTAVPTSPARVSASPLAVTFGLRAAPLPHCVPSKNAMSAYLVGVLSSAFRA